MKISQILPKESGSKRKNDTQQEYFLHLNTQPEGVPEVKKGGLKGATAHPYWLSSVPIMQQVKRIFKAHRRNKVRYSNINMRAVVLNHVQFVAL